MQDNIKMIPICYSLKCNVRDRCLRAIMFDIVSEKIKIISEEEQLTDKCKYFKKASENAEI